jgi:acid phosphatase type 7
VRWGRTTWLPLLAAAVGLVALFLGALALGRDDLSDSPLGEPSAVVWAVGDAYVSERGKALAARVVADRPKRFLYLGDVYDRGTASEFATNYAPLYGSLARVTAPTPGDHEWPLRREGYEPYWRRAHGRPIPSFYAFKEGGWEILSLNSEDALGPNSPQLRWLRSHLRRARGTCRVAFWHRPRYSGDARFDQKDVSPLWNALRGRATMVLSGNAHNLQRHKPRAGLIQFIVGAGGRSVYPVDEDYPGLAFADDRSDGALRLELSPGAAEFEFVSADGKVLDAGRIPCRRDGA